MSLLAKKPLPFDSSVKVELKENNIIVKGPKGETIIKLIDGITLDMQENQVFVNRKDDSIKNFQGLIWSLLKNAIYGVSTGFSKTLLVQGKGWRSKVEGSIIDLQVGYSHPVKYKLPAGVTATQANPGEFTLFCHDKQLLGATVAEIVKYRPVEPYKQKGIIVQGQYIRKK